MKTESCWTKMDQIARDYDNMAVMAAKLERQAYYLDKVVEDTLGAVANVQSDQRKTAL